MQKVHQKQEKQPQEPKSDNTYYIVGGAVLGFLAGSALAYFAGASTLTSIDLAAVIFTVAAAICAVLGALAGDAVSKYFEDPNVKAHNKKSEVPKHCVSH